MQMGLVGARDKVGHVLAGLSWTSVSGRLQKERSPGEDHQSVII